MPPTPEDDQEPETTVFYVVYDDGSTGRIESTCPPRLTRPGSFVSQDRYGERQQQLADGTAQYVTGLLAVETAKAQADYEALLLVGIPAATASRLTGHVPPEAGEDGGLSL